MNRLQVYNFFARRRGLEKGGCLIAFEGIDGSGKSTYVGKTADYLKDLGYRVHTVVFPRYGEPTGRVISTYLKGGYGDVANVPHELMSVVYGADRAGARDRISYYVNNGYIVLADRYTYSNVFMAAKLGVSERVSFVEWIEDLEFNQLKVVRPHWNILLHVDPEVAFDRIAKRNRVDRSDGRPDIHEGNRWYLREVADTYLRLARSRPDWRVVDQVRDGQPLSVDGVFEVIKIHVHDILGNRLNDTKG